MKSSFILLPAFSEDREDTWVRVSEISTISAYYANGAGGSRVILKNGQTRATDLTPRKVMDLVDSVEHGE